MEARDRSRWVMAQARELGFDLAGIAPASDFPELNRLEEWLARGHAGDMRYLHDPRRRSPARALEGARSLIVCAINYNTAPEYSTLAVAPRSPNDSGDRPQGWISRYAWGDDYHDVLGQRLRALLERMRVCFDGDFDARAYVDTGPIIERIAGKYAGLGWLGKNTCLIHHRLGSWLFLGVIVTTLEFEPTLRAKEVPLADLCGSCRLCLDACPTGALVEPYLLDARRCISYLTIERRGPIPEEFRPQIGAMVFGCDICQDVCPWNRKAPTTRLAAFEPRQPKAGRSLFAPELEWLAGMDEEEFRQVFRRSAVKRAKWRGLVRNACTALGNCSAQLAPKTRERICQLLAHLARSSDPLIAEHAGWGLSRLKGGRD